MEGKALKVKAPRQEDANVLDSDAAFPSMAALRDGKVVLAWEQGGAIVVKGWTEPQLDPGSFRAGYRFKS